jgi:hypothetical protein
MTLDPVCPGCAANGDGSFTCWGQNDRRCQDRRKVDRGPREAGRTLRRRLARRLRLFTGGNG